MQRNNTTPEQRDGSKRSVQHLLHVAGVFFPIARRDDIFQLWNRLEENTRTYGERLMSAVDTTPRT